LSGGINCGSHLLRRRMPQMRRLLEFGLRLLLQNSRKIIFFRVAGFGNLRICGHVYKIIAYHSNHKNLRSIIAGRNSDIGYHEVLV